MSLHRGSEEGGNKVIDGALISVMKRQIMGFTSGLPSREAASLDASISPRRPDSGQAATARQSAPGTYEGRRSSIRADSSGVLRQYDGRCDTSSEGYIKTTRARLIFALSIFAPACALAQNGVVQINQSAISVSGLNRSAGGFPYTILQSGSYQLTSNLTVPANANGIVISASNVTLDLNGFSITNNTCSNNCNSSAVTDVGVQQFGVTIRNGNIFGFGNGINLNATTGTLVEKVRVQSAANIGMQVSDSFTIKDCAALGNGGDGIVVGNHGIVSGTLANGNGNYGIVTGTVTLTGNTVDSNAVGGIFTGSNSTVIGNTASNHTSGAGFTVGLGSTITGNTSSANQNGFLLNCPSNLIGNTAVGDVSPSNATGNGCNQVNNLGP
jgi:parallel beta-helix repeat protein